jgi:phage terminase large subunit
MLPSQSLSEQELTSENEVSTGYAPREPQKTIHKAIKNNRWTVAVAHRRMGKTVCAINQLIHSALKCEKKSPQFAYIAPTYGQAKRIAWNYLVDYTRPLGGTANVSELRVDFMGRRISLYGADNPDSIRGIYLDGVVIDEIGDVHPSLFTEVIRPALSDRLGWALFIGTPKGANHFKELRDFADDSSNDGWTLREFKASETGLIPEEELKDAQKAMGDNKYQQEFEVSFDSPIIGSYYGELIKDISSRNHVREIPSESATGKFTAWDLGVSDSTSIWVIETIGGEVRLMDYFEDAGKGLDHYVEYLDTNGYRDYTHILPHDVAVRELQTGKSRYEFLTDAGLNIDIAPKSSVEDGIQAVRRMLPNCWFNESTTKHGLECLRNYRREFNEKLNTFMEKPKHDWSSHGADAFRYLALGLDTSSTSKRSNWSKPYESTYSGDSYKKQYM